MELLRLLAQRLRESREEAGLTLAEAAQECGLEVDALAGFEAAQREPMLEEVRQLAELYDVTMDYLAGMHDPGWIVHHTGDGEVELLPRKPMGGRVIGQILPADPDSSPDQDEDRRD